MFFRGATTLNFAKGNCGEDRALPHRCFHSLKKFQPLEEKRAMPKEKHILLCLKSVALVRVAFPLTLDAFAVKHLFSKPVSRKPSERLGWLKERGYDCMKGSLSIWFLFPLKILTSASGGEANQQMRS